MMHPKGSRPHGAQLEKQSGQALPLMLVGLVAVLAALVLMLNLGRLMLHREEAKDRADVTAFSGAVDYARILNVLSAIKKAEAAASVATATTGAGAPFLAWLKRSDAFLTGQGPWLVEASVIHLGVQNGLQVTPLWNLRESPVGWNAWKHSLRPSLNIGAPNEYTFVKKENGLETTVDPEGVEEIEVKGRNGQAYKRYRLRERKTFVKRSAIEGSQVHALTLVALRPPRVAQAASPWLWHLPPIKTVSHVAIEGGNLKVFSWKSALWEPFFVPLKDPGNTADQIGQP